MTETTLAALTKQPWWRIDLYENDETLPPYFEEVSGPKGVALVKAWPDGKTDRNWGRETFMAAYMKDDFNARRCLYGFERDRWAFAIVMRSVRMICVDIDGKNGGLEHAKRLGQLPPTLAETSKSGNGFHLFYKVDDSWDVDYGYDSLYDHIGIEQGVDIRSAGCVYHHKQQRWNYRPPVMLPSHLHDQMLARRQRTEFTNERIVKVLEAGDDMEILMMQDELLTDLKKPIPQGKRNTTLFAIGQKMKQSAVPDWEQHIADRATQLGLDGAEITQLVKNIGTYN